MLLYVPRYANYRAVFCKQQVAIIWLLHLGSYIVHAALALYCTWTPCTPNSPDKSLSQPWCSQSHTIYKMQLQKTIVLRMQPRNLDAATTMRSADTELRNTIELRATASEIAVPKPDLDAKAKKKDFEALFKRTFTRKIASA